MEIKSGKRLDFWGYITPLRHLEQAFQMIGIRVNFTLNFDSRNESKTLSIKTKYGEHHISLDYHSPKAAVTYAAIYLGSGYKEIKKEEENGQAKKCNRA